MKILFLILVVLQCVTGTAQLYIGNNADLSLQKGGELYVEGDIDSYSNIQGEGNVIFIGQTLQYLNMHGREISNLLVSNPNEINLLGDIYISGVAELSNGNINLGNNTLSLGEKATAVAGNGHYINTNGTGTVRKKISSDLSAYTLPLGSGSVYTPVLLNSKGSYTNAWVDISAKNSVNPHIPLSSTDYLETWWTVTKTGINGNLTTTVQYPTIAINGDERELQGFYWNGNKLMETSASASREITTTVKNDRIELMAINAGKIRTTLSPNPVRNSATMTVYSKVAENGFIKVLDTRGKNIYTKSVSLVPGFNNFSVPMSNLRNGYYNVYLSSAGKNENIKVIKL